jgi:hypothetical protein
MFLSCKTGKVLGGDLIVYFIDKKILGERYSGTPNVRGRTLVLIIQFPAIKND